MILWIYLYTFSNVRDHQTVCYIQLLNKETKTIYNFFLFVQMFGKNEKKNGSVSSFLIFYILCFFLEELLNAENY